MQAHDFFTDAEETVVDAKDAVKDEADRATSSGPSQTVPRPSGLYGKDPIPSNTEEVEHWRRTHPRPARGTVESDAGEGAKQAAKDSWASVKGQTQEAADAMKGKTRQAADDVKGKAEDVKGKASERADQANDKADETADGIAGWAKSWFGKPLGTQHVLYHAMELLCAVNSGFSECFRLHLASLDQPCILLRLPEDCICCSSVPSSFGMRGVDSPKHVTILAQPHVSS